MAACTLIALAFGATGGGLLLQQGWWRTAAIDAALPSTLLYALTWDGTGARLDAQGAVAIAINVLVIAAARALPTFDFER